jgi:Domain of unknown function (DUF4389)
MEPTDAPPPGEAPEPHDAVTDSTATTGTEEHEHPIRLVVTDDLHRNRLTVFFRAILVIPALIWLSLWGIVTFLAWIVAWFAAVFTAKVPDGLHQFMAAYLRYQTHVYAYFFLIADPYPGFSGKPGYPIDLEVDPPERQSRLTVFFRLILAIPALILASVLSYISRLLAFFSWFIALALGRVPEGIRNFAAFALRVETQTYAYAMLLTERYPSFNVGIQA